MDDVRKGWETARSSGRALTLLSLSFGLSLNSASAQGVDAARQAPYTQAQAATGAQVYETACQSQNLNRYWTFAKSARFVRRRSFPKKSCSSMSLPSISPLMRSACR